MTTFLAIAENSKLDFVSFSAGASGKLEKVDGPGFLMTEITLKPKLVVSRDRDVERATRILEKAEKHCLISNSIKARTKLEPEIEIVNPTLWVVNESLILNRDWEILTIPVHDLRFSIYDFRFGDRIFCFAASLFRCLAKSEAKRS